MIIADANPTRPNDGKNHQPKESEPASISRVIPIIILILARA